MRPIIVTPRLTLRPLHPQDAGPITRYSSDARVARMTTSIPHPYPPGLAETFIAGTLAGRRDETVWAMDAGQSGSDSLVGLVSFRDDEDEVGYWVGPPFWGTGYATEAVSGVVDAVFADTGRDRVQGSVFRDNTASAWLLAKLGFVRERPERHWSAARGAEAEAEVFGLSRATWMVRHAARREAAR